MTGPRAEVVVDLDAVAHNVRTLSRAAGDAAMMTVVKADGYGHGMLEVARAAREAGSDWLGVAVLEEALALRAGGDTGRILTWLAVPGEDYREAVAADVDLTAYTLAELAEIESAAREAGTPARVQLKVDTGLNRGGSTLQDWPRLTEAAARAESDGAVAVTGVWSHLACADEPDHPANAAQERAFGEALAVAQDAGLRPEVRHLANSAATVTRPSARFDLVRCGIASYGHSPVPTLATSAELGLVPAMTVQGRLALVKPVPAGGGVSYGHTWTAPSRTTVAVVPLGYGDGVPRHASSTASVSVAGVRCPVRGRVCMDQLVVEVAHLDPPPAAGDAVVLFGPGTHAEPTAQDWAEACGTISYEIVTRAGGSATQQMSRMTRRHTRGGAPA